MHYSKETSIGVFPQKKKGMITIKIWLFVFMLCAIIGLGIATIVTYTSTIPELEREYDDRISYRDDEIERLKSKYPSTILQLEREYDHKISIKDDEINRLESIVGRLKDANFENFSKEMAKHNPILVSNVEVCDASNDFGEDIQAEKSTYLTVRVLVASFIQGRYDLYYKLYYPSGRLCQYAKDVDAYVEDYTAMKSMVLDPYEFKFIRFPTIGNKEEGCWSSGTYKIEIYFRGRCIGDKEFKIY